MKKLALLAGLALGGLASYAQGYINTFNAFSPTPGGAIAYLRDYVASGEGALLSKATGRVEILTADGSTVLSPIKDGTGNPLAVDGLFSLGVTAIPGTTPGSSGSIMLRAWDSSTGSTWASALERAEVTITFASLGANTAPSNFVTGSNFTGLQLDLVPEPSTVALAALGVVGLFFAVRRKS
jgi:hypothetical protein